MNDSFEVAAAVPVARVAGPLAKLLRSAARRERLVRETVEHIEALNLRGPQLATRIDRLMAALLTPLPPKRARPPRAS